MGSFKTDKTGTDTASYNITAVSFADSTTKVFSLFEIRCQIFSVHEDRETTDTRIHL